MHAEDEQAAVTQYGGNATGGLSLQRVIEIGECQVAAQHEVERAVRHGCADVLPQETHSLPVALLQAVFPVSVMR